MNRNLSLCGLVAVSLMLPACATITRGSSQKYNIETTPSEAEVKLSTGQTCTSPCNLKLKRKHGFTVTAKKSGYEEATAVVDSRVRGGGVAGAAGNIIAGGLIGVAVDASSGAMNDLTPNPLRIELKPVAAAVVEAAPAPVADAAPAVEIVEPTAATPSDAIAPVAAPTEGAAAEAVAEQAAPGL